MSNAFALTSTPHSLKQFDAIVEEAANAPAPPAKESIAAAKALFTSGYKQSQIAMVYNGLDERVRGIILLTGRADHNLRDKNFKELDDLTREKIRRGLIALSGMIRRFNNSVGHIEKTLPSDFR